MVSVIIPVFNGEKYIENIIECFKKQIYRDFEIIFINDGSIDSSKEKIEECILSINMKIYLFNQPHRGVSSARNNGIYNASGEYICFCDVDDQVTENYLFLMMKLMKEHQLDLIICRMNRIKYKIELKERRKISEENGRLEIFNADRCLEKFLYGDIVAGMCNVLVRKKVIVENRLYFKEGYKYGEDLHMMWRVMSYAKRIGHLDSMLYLYFDRCGSAMSIFNKDRLDSYYLMKELEDFFKKSSPGFYAEYKKYGVSKIIWSITWQAAAHLNKKEFNEFTNNYNALYFMKKLIFFKNFKVRYSSILYLISKSLFRIFARLIGRKYIH